jgi:hypothetical protein
LLDVKRVARIKTSHGVIVILRCPASERSQERSLFACVGDVRFAENVKAVKNRIGVQIPVVVALRIQRVEHHVGWCICELLESGNYRRLLDVLTAGCETANRYK